MYNYVVMYVVCNDVMCIMYVVGNDVIQERYILGRACASGQGACQWQYYQ